MISQALGLTPQQLNQFQASSSHRRAVSSPAEPYPTDRDITGKFPLAAIQKHSFC